MTNEEAIKKLKEFKILHTEQAGWDTSTLQALDIAIKALEKEPCCNCIEFKRYAKEMGFDIEQKPVLDKIRAEIKALSPKPTAYDVVDGNPIKDAIWETLVDVLAIIDKYKA